MRRPAAAASGHSTRALQPAAARPRRGVAAASDISSGSETSNARTDYTAFIPLDEARR
ncbi:hypothetical protein BURCENBC7_AP5933 [Burkholderia cenocepacia BC7]|nr:hypothetical protein BURCENK562V_C5993 [Burkholderia cenocepacia K56-2Valvano]ERI25260.1 hypothetical protein BURCENBC7_AP5933 [Burkholderia cenocepacia BC7]